MERIEDQPIIDLGAASVETKGAIGDFKDEVADQLLPGLSND